ncbi:translocation/assembly module TamB domain-containing protein [Pelagicoccus albus]|uniref:Translocation/assembly module TamB domain-containing protein n=1 Tax=Pelagicoccus albus TaxID=415222 RepID=A0A7X1E958_9BACT|nr:translocation/assembly module TamB domain-containing protein [Pelagicoccus albus]MBC2607011.1 translocation/assembly module TamB domain-containing protein [Pelagicoccus albus]
MTNSPPKKQKKPRFKKTKRVAIALLAVFVLTVLSFPLWSPWIAKPLAAMAGVNMDSVDALSWDRWQISRLEYAQENLTATAESIELPSPTKLVFSHFSSKPATQNLAVQNWKLDITTAPAPEEKQATEPLTPHAIFKLVNDSLAQLGNYLASVEVSEGIVVVDGVETASIEDVQLSPLALAVKAGYMPQSLEAELKLTFESEQSWDLEVMVPTYELSLESTLTSTTETTEIGGTLLSSGNRVELEAAWADDFIPKTASVRSSGFGLDQRYPFMANLEKVPAVQLNVLANWASEAFDYQLEAFDASEQSEEANIFLAGKGSQKLVQIETAKVNLPWLLVENDKPIELDFSLENPLEAAMLEAKLDLAKVPYIEAGGKVEATLTTKTSSSGTPIISAKLAGANVSLWDTALATLEANLDLDGKQASIHSFAIVSEKGSELSLRGGYNIETQELAPSTLHLKVLNESQRLRDLLPEFDWQAIDGDLEVSGPATDPQFAGSLQLDSVKFPQTQMLSLDAQVNGRLSSLTAELAARTELEKLNLALAVERGSEAMKLTLNQLALALIDGAPILTLDQPATVEMDNETGDATLANIALDGSNGEQLQLSSFLLSSASFDIQATASNFRTDIFNNWLATPVPNFSIQELDTDIHLTEDASEIKTSGSAAWAITDTSTIGLNWTANSNPESRNNINIDHLEIGADSKHILVAEGQFPISIYWAQKAIKTEILHDAPVAFSLESSPHPDFWNSLAKVVPVALKKPVIRANLEGTLDNPTGHINLQLASLDWTHPTEPSRSLSLRDFKTTLDADSDGIEISQLEAHFGNNIITANATLPLGDTTLLQAAQNATALDLAPLTGHARIELVEFAALKAWLPPIIRQEGKAIVDANFENGKISAVAEIENLATRPAPPLSAMSKISGRVRYEEGIVTVEKLTGTAEKSPFSLAGTADINDIERPRLDLKFTSKEFPMLRDDGLVMSGDIDVAVVSPDKAPPQIKGSVMLTKGLFLVEPNLIASSAKTVSTRPPYFAVEQEPFKDWGLNLTIRGDEFLRVSNSFFEGTLSADFVLEGSLGTPLLIGKAETNSGRVIFPASSLNLKNGQALITRDRPSELQLEAIAEGRLFAYDVSLDVSGTVDDIELVITSNPALTQVDALLLLTTGTVPDSSGSLAQNSASSLGMFIGKGLFRKLTGGNSDSASKLNVEVGQEISHQGKKTINATYQLSETLEVEGEYDKRDEFNGNLKWTFFRR